MIKGLAITPPVLGRISIGRVVEKNGWLLHPLDEELRKNAPNGKLRTIPVRMLFNEADLNLRAEYTMFDRKSGRPMCVGNGDTCKRRTQSGVQSLPCPSPSLCEFGKGGLCKPYGRLNVKVGDDDDLGTFIFRTTGYNSIRTLAARLSYYQAVSGGLLAYMPLELKLRGKSTTQSRRTPIYYVDLGIKEGVPLQEAVAEAQEKARQMKEEGVDQAALDLTAAKGFGNALFEYDEDEVSQVVEEFYPPTIDTDEGPVDNSSVVSKLRKDVDATRSVSG
ncbi:hypothetical protein SAMN04488490_2570 [Marinobacter sp. LV10R510-11A]|uniref:recombination directionality factor n=1 Tax=Marinobacter sp. LV10R510-11A TaxID=1415568 RepID=UPI000BB789C3|nr:hydrolase or metal-binding protein [Marinobacter sp. LV10R510-11A]SOB76839.1 hypothetical protein SAMN04488490_2570 [Marinobacter sp. LV10R510-11A]